MSTWLITGCSTGLGRALAEAVIGAGHNAVVTARDVAAVSELAESAPERVLAAALDVTDPAQVASAVRRAQDRFDHIDVLVNNAGYGYRAAVEEGDDADVRALFAAVESPEPPAFLLLGPHALAAYRYKADARAAEISQWEELTSSTDFG
jgi:NAD(P)-dependent dehydrogenase (short-subunit alcohol dehydrogenase family)